MNSSTNKYLVAIVGRPNVGKSTLFNRLIGERRAILSDVPGTTRDVLFGDVTWNDFIFGVADTAGLEPDNDTVMAQDILLQTKSAIESADLIYFMVNAAEGLLPDDRTAAEMIRKSGKPAILLINKTDQKIAADNVYDFHQLGFTNTFETAGTSGKGTGDVLDETVLKLKEIEAANPRPELAADESQLIRVAIVGRPNVGKSTLFNKLVGKKRSIVSDEAGTTRDTVNETIKHENYTIEFIDTAGLRRRGKVEWGIEKYGSLRMIKAIQSADLCMMIMESDEGVIAQDAHIMQSILQADRSPILIVNKWDLIEKTHRITADYETYLQEKYKFAKWIPVMFISALTGQRVNKIIDNIIKVWQTRNVTLPETDLKNILTKAVLNRPPIARRVIPKVTGFRQVATNPPLIQLSGRHIDSLHFSYLRYLENRIRESFPLLGTPIQFSLKEASKHIRPS